MYTIKYLDYDYDDNDLESTEDPVEDRGTLPEEPRDYENDPYNPYEEEEEEHGGEFEGEGYYEEEEDGNGNYV